LELKYAAKEKSLESELNQYKVKASEMEKTLKKNRKNENHMKEELVKANNQVSLQKQNFDQSLFKLQNENKGLKEALSFKTNSYENKISELNKKLIEVKSLNETHERELPHLRAMNEDLMKKLEGFKSMKEELDQEKTKCQNAELKIKELEFTVESYGDWKELEKASTSRMIAMSEMEKENTRLRQGNKSLNESLGNKLLLEEQVLSMQTRIERFEKAIEDQVALQTKIESLEKELVDWHRLGNDFVPKGNAPNPINVRFYIEKLLHRDLLLVSEKSDASSENSTMQSELSDSKMVST
jgi:DNA repair exonuclease SbcCD ATPase subunit